MKNYVRFVVHPTDEDKVLIEEIVSADIQLQDYLYEIQNDGLEEFCEGIQPDDKDCLVLATFTYRTESSFNGESTDYEDVLEVEEVIILCRDYKRHWHRNLAMIYGHSTLEELEANSSMADIHEWEEFYEEDYEHETCNASSTKITL